MSTDVNICQLRFPTFPTEALSKDTGYDRYAEIQINLIKWV